MQITTFILPAALFASGCALRLHHRPAPFTRWLMVWVVASTVAEAIGVTCTHLGVPNVHYFNAFVLIEFLILLRIARLDPVARVLRPPHVHLLLAAFILIWAADLYTIGRQYQFAMHAFLVATPILVAIYLLLLWHLVNTHRGPLSGHPPFWLYLTVLIFYGTVAPILGSVNYLGLYEPQLGAKLMRIVSAMSIVKFILLSIACLRTPRQPALPT